MRSRIDSSALRAACAFSADCAICALSGICAIYVPTSSLSRLHSPMILRYTPFSLSLCFLSTQLHNQRRLNSNLKFRRFRTHQTEYGCTQLQNSFLILCDSRLYLHVKLGLVENAEGRGMKVGTRECIGICKAAMNGNGCPPNTALTFKSRTLLIS
ncbi:uncharacterized protein LY89DRAFT_74048 [Mollisia scopiformis]|uniref:Uncharacterized protein n=1 Tax=Mollisia scopiformis TaxID=149040 RepID=A0A194XBT4_MOLSC|nr:uncharacterized protein LY89DRAFT_74048 [Mollisia scopiformis]KUJ17217.1 hypothetical protein LY89DRAFT_74048 [Mollisia scopiformis]